MGHVCWCVMMVGALAMVGTISLYDKAGERLHKTYIGATPEYGIITFFQRMVAEIEEGKCCLPHSVY